MKFRLVYEGELRSNQRRPMDGQFDKLAVHKQAIRKKFHLQLKHLWETNEFLSSHRVYAQDYGIDVTAGTTSLPLGIDESERISLIDAVASQHAEQSYRFVPLVRKAWGLSCSLNILFLRHDPPGSVYHAGDLDNRMKTLIDALRKPDGPNELRGNESPGEGEDPFFCLLEDDRLIAGLNVESDRYLYPPSGNSDHHRLQAHVVVTVEIRPYRVTNFNLSFV